MKPTIHYSILLLLIAVLDSRYTSRARLNETGQYAKAKLPINAQLTTCNCCTFPSFNARLQKILKNGSNSACLLEHSWGKCIVSCPYS